MAFNDYLRLIGNNRPLYNKRSATQSSLSPLSQVNPIIRNVAEAGGLSNAAQGYQNYLAEQAAQEAALRAEEERLRLAAEEEARRRAEEERRAAEEAARRAREEADSKRSADQQASRDEAFSSLMNDRSDKAKKLSTGQAGKDYENRVKGEVYGDSEPKDEKAKARNEWIRDAVENGYQNAVGRGTGADAEPVSFEEALSAWDSATRGEIAGDLPIVGTSILKGMARDRLASTLTARRQGVTDQQSRAKGAEDALLKWQTDVQQSARDALGVGGRAGSADFLQDPGAFALDAITGLVPGMASIIPSNMRGAANLLNNTTINDRGEAEGRLPSQLFAEAASPAIDAASMLYTGGLGAAAGKAATSGLRGAVGTAARDIGKSVVEEASTEAAQTALEASAAGRHVDQNDLVNSIAGGAIGGGVFSGGTALSSGAANVARRGIRSVQASSGTGTDIAAPNDMSAAGIRTDPLAAPQQPVPTSSIQSFRQAPSDAVASPVATQADINVPQAAPSPMDAPQVPAGGAQAMPAAAQMASGPDNLNVHYPTPAGSLVSDPLDYVPRNASGSLEIGDEFRQAAREHRSMEADNQAAARAAEAAARTTPTGTQAVRDAVDNPVARNINAAAEVILPDMVKANDAVMRGENVEVSSRELDTANETMMSVLEPLADKQAGMSSYVKDGSMSREDASAELLAAWFQSISDNPSSYTGGKFLTKILSGAATRPSNVLSRAMKSESAQGGALTEEAIVKDETASGSVTQVKQSEDSAKKERREKNAEARSDKGETQIKVKNRDGRETTLNVPMTIEQYEANRKAPEKKPEEAPKQASEVNWDQVSRSTSETAENVMTGVLANPEAVNVAPTTLSDAWAAREGLDPEAESTVSDFYDYMQDAVSDKIAEKNREGIQYKQLSQYYNAVATDIKNSSDVAREIIEGETVEKKAASGDRKAQATKKKIEGRKKRAEARKAADAARTPRQGRRRLDVNRSPSAALTDAQRMEDSVVSFVDELMKSDLVRDVSVEAESSANRRMSRETAAKGFGDEALLKDVLPLSEVQEHVADSLMFSSFSDMPANLKDLVNEIYEDDNFRPSNYYNRSPKLSFKDGRIRSSEPGPTLYFAASDLGTAKSIDPKGLLRATKLPGGRVEFRDISGRPFDITLKPVITAMIMASNENAPVYISKPGAIDRRIVGVAVKVDGVQSIVLNSLYAKNGGLTQPHRAEEGTFAHESTHVLLRALDISDVPRAEALRSRMADIVDDPYFDRFREEVDSYYQKNSLSPEARVEEVLAAAVDDYAVKIEQGQTGTVPERVKKWMQDFLAFVKRTFHLQQYSVTEIVAFTPEQLVEVTTLSAFQGAMVVAPDPMMTLTTDQILDEEPSTVREILSDGDEAMEHDMVETIDFGEMRVPRSEKPRGAVDAVPASSVKKPSSLVNETTLKHDSDGAPIPPGKMPEDSRSLMDLVESEPLWREYYDEQQALDSDKLFTINGYEEQQTARDFLKRHGRTPEIARGAFLSISSKLYDPLAEAVAIQNYSLSVERKEARGTKKKGLSAEERAELIRKKKKALEVAKVSNAKVLIERSRTRMAGFARRTGMIKVRDWVKNNEPRQQLTRDYMDARQIIGAMDVLYDDPNQFNTEAKTRGFKNVEDLREWADGKAANSGLPKNIENAIDKSVRDLSDHIVNSAYEAGEITREHRDNLLEKNEDGSYWIMKVENAELEQAQKDVLGGDPNALINPSDKTLVKQTAEEFTTTSMHPLEAMFTSLEISTFRTDKARMNQSVLTYLMREGLSKEFDLDIYENGSKSLPPQAETGLGDAEYKKLKKTADDLSDNYYDGEGAEFSYLTVFEDGQMKAYAVPADIYNAMADLGYQESDVAGVPALSVLANFARKFSGIVRWTTTTANVTLQTVLLARDLLTISMFGPASTVSGAFTPRFMAKALYSTIFKNSTLSEMGIAGDAFARASTRDPRAEAQRSFTMGNLNPGTAKATTEFMGTHVEHVLNGMETFARATLYYQAYQAYADKGFTAKDANTAAVTLAAEGLGNFLEAGSWVRTVSSYAAYSNAALQGSKGAVKLFARQPVANTIRTAGAIATVYLVSLSMMAALGYDYDDWKEAVEALPDSQRYRGIPMPKIGEAPAIDYETGEIKGVWIFPMPEVMYPILNLMNDPNHQSRNETEALFDRVTLAFMGFTGIDIHGDGWLDMSRSLANQWIPNVVKPFVEIQMNMNLYSGNALVKDDDMSLYREGLATRNELTTYGASDLERSIADFLSENTPLDVNAIDIDSFSRSMGAMISNLSNGKAPWSFGGMVNPFMNRRAVSPFLEEDAQALLRSKWSDPLYALSVSERGTALDDFGRSYSAATNLSNEIRKGLSKEELRLLVDPENGDTAPDERTLLIVGINLRAEQEGWDKQKTAEEVSRLYTRNASELFDSAKYSKENVAEYYSYLGVVGEAFNSPRLKAQARLATSERFWKPGITGDEQQNMMKSLKTDYSTANAANIRLARALEASDDPNIRIETMKAVDGLSDKQRIIFSRYEQDFDETIWYSASDIKEELAADTADIDDQTYNDHALKYYQALYDADGACYRGSKDDLSSTSSSGYLLEAAKINSQYNIPKSIQLYYGDADADNWNISLTAWKELEETDPALFQALYDYDTLRTEAGVSRKQGKHGERKYYKKASSGYSRGGYGGGYGSGGAAAFHVPSVSDLALKTYTPKGGTQSTSETVTKKSVAPFKREAAKTVASGGGIKTEPTNFKGADTVKYKRATTRQPAMGEPYETFLKGGSTQDSFKAARRYV